MFPSTAAEASLICTRTAITAKSMKSIKNIGALGLVIQAAEIEFRIQGCEFKI